MCALYTEGTLLDLDTHLQKLEENNRKLFSAKHYSLLILAFATLVLMAVVLLEPMFGIALSGFIAFFLNHFYSQYTFKKLNARVTLLQTKIDSMNR